MICIIDYGAGNLRSVQKAVEHLGGEAQVSSSSADILSADKVILPGVGAFGKAVDAIDELDLRRPILQVIKNGKPFLGICLGMQLLMESSQESPGAAGLAVLPGTVVRFPRGRKVPHLGWNSVKQIKSCALWQDIPDLGYFYFAHSYYITPLDEEDVVGVTEYGQQVAVAINQGSLFGLQFHPEKSQKNGLGILNNFIKLTV
jgi:imidazole glycerol-phosphate synthase subunit HisH